MTPQATKQRHRKLHPVAAGSRWALFVERCPSGIVALHQNDQIVTLRQRDLYEVASALADWVHIPRQIP